MGKGGMRWGAGRPASKGKCEASQRIDVREWARRGMLVPGCSGSWRWTNTSTGEETGSIGYCVEQGAVVLSYALNGESKTQRVPLLTTPCNYGNSRPWFACPYCAARVAVIYMRRGGFYCRKCAGVAYYSQSEDAIGRAWRKQQKAEARLGRGWARPKGMHATTHEHLLEVIFRCEDMRDVALAGFMARHIGLFTRDERLL
jgi:hypothetical protein